MHGAHVSLFLRRGRLLSRFCRAASCGGMALPTLARMQLHLPAAASVAGQAPRSTRREWLQPRLYCTHGFYASQVGTRWCSLPSLLVTSLCLCTSTPAALAQASHHAGRGQGCNGPGGDLCSRRGDGLAAQHLHSQGSGVPSSKAADQGQEHVTWRPGGPRRCRPLQAFACSGGLASECLQLCLWLGYKSPTLNASFP